MECNRKSARPEKIPEPRAGGSFQLEFHGVYWRWTGRQGVCPMGIRPKSGVACLFAGIAAGLLFLFSGLRWGHVETIRLDGASPLHLAQAPAEAIPIVRPGDHLIISERRIPFIDIECVRFHLVRDRQTLAAWTVGAWTFALGLAGLSLLAGLVVAFLGRLLAWALDPATRQ
jgi:hypothetical protein